MKFEILKSRRHWDQHEPKMWSKASGLSDDELTGFKLEVCSYRARDLEGLTRISE